MSRRNSCGKFFQGRAGNLNARTLAEAFQQNGNALRAAEVAFKDSLQSAERAFLDLHEIARLEFGKLDGNDVLLAMREDRKDDRFFDDGRLAAETDNVGDAVGILDQPRRARQIEASKNVAREQRPDDPLKLAANRALDFQLRKERLHSLTLQTAL